MRKTKLVILCVALLGAVGTFYPLQAQGPIGPFLTPPVTPAVTDTTVAPAPLVTEVTVIGLKDTPAVVQQQVRDIAGRLRGKPYNDEEIDKVFYAIDDTGYFWGLMARPVTVAKTADGVQLTFTLSENTTVTGIDFIGNTVFTAETLQQILKTKVGQVMNFTDMSSDAKSLTDYYRSRGYTMMTLNSQSQDPQTGRVRFEIFECRISSIIIKGNYKTREYVIVREMMIKEGDVYNQNKVRDTLETLRRMSIFLNVKLEQGIGKELGTIDLIYTFEEQFTGSASGGITTGSNSRPLLYLTLQDSNFLGTAQSIGLMGSFGDTTSYRFNYSNPYLNANRMSGAVNVYSMINPRSVKNSTGSFDYDEHRTGLNLTIGQPVDATTREYFTARADHIYGESSNTSALLDPLKSATDVRSLGYSLVRDARDNALNPSAGYYRMGSIEVAGLGGRDFTKVQAEGRYYLQVKPGVEGKTYAENKQPWVYAGRITLGLIKGDAPYLDQFLAGGTNTNTIRGYAEDSFPGKALFVMNNELRVPINNTLQAVGFLDIGDAFGGSFASSFGDADARARIGYGLGMRINSPVGPIRLDWGFTPEGSNRVHFGIGATY